MIDQNQALHVNSTCCTWRKQNTSGPPHYRTWQYRHINNVWLELVAGSFLGTCLQTPDFLYIASPIGQCFASVKSPLIHFANLPLNVWFHDILHFKNGTNMPSDKWVGVNKYKDSSIEISRYNSLFIVKCKIRKCIFYYWTLVNNMHAGTNQS